jgi:hypothetical protein
MQLMEYENHQHHVVDYLEKENKINRITLYEIQNYPKDIQLEKRHWMVDQRNCHQYQ